jgi:hypothetical protein
MTDNVNVAQFGALVLTSKSISQNYAQLGALVLTQQNPAAIVQQLNASVFYTIPYNGSTQPVVTIST